VDINVYSNTGEEHVKHLDAVLGKLTTAGFTINIDKCDFCKQEIKLLGHVIPHSTVEVCDSNGKIKDQFNWNRLRFIRKQLMRFNNKKERQM
jgi:recombinational DNA repair protein (RecF pathway)